MVCSGPTDHPPRLGQDHRSPPRDRRIVCDRRWMQPRRLHENWAVGRAALRALRLAGRVLLPRRYLPTSERAHTNVGRLNWSPCLFVFEVADTSSEYDYLIKVRSPNGKLFTYEGDVETVGNNFGGESCTPTMYSRRTEHQPQRRTDNSTAVTIRECVLPGGSRGHVTTAQTCRSAALDITAAKRGSAAGTRAASRPVLQCSIIVGS